MNKSAVFFRVSSVMILSGLAACAQNCAPDQVATGVARLTMHNLGAVLQAAEMDSACGFSSAAVLANSSSDGEVGQLGSVTWTATDCHLDFSADTPLATDCLGQVSRASGSIVFSATKTLSGLRTGRSDSPIMPVGSDALRYDFSAINFEDFWPQIDADDNSLQMLDGSLRAVLSPRLAIDSNTGTCSQATPNIQFRDVVYARSNVILHGADLKENVPVASSKMQAQSGVGLTEKNALDGYIVVWSESRQVPGAKEAKGLDPAFDPESFAQAYSCQEALAQPPSFVCADMHPQLVDASARFTVPLIAAVAAAIQDNSSCGFASSQVQNALTVSAEAGSTGDASWQVTDCVLDFPQATVVTTDCQGLETMLQGKVQVSASKVLHGMLTGDPDDPVLADGDDALSMHLDLQFMDLTLSNSASDDSFQLRSGDLATDLQVQQALNAEGVCDVATANLRVTGAQYSQADLLLGIAQGKFALAVDASDFNALSGHWGEQENALDGSMQVEGQSYEVNSDGLGCDPGYDAESFAATWQCDSRLRPNTTDDCSPRRMLAQKTARDGVALLHAVAEQLRTNSDCGFAADSVVQQVVLSDQNPGAKGYAMFQVNDCVLDFVSPTPVHQDCAGQVEYLQGRATVSASMRVDGWLTADVHEPVLPDNNLASQIDLTIQGEGLRWSRSLDDRAVQLGSGELQGTVQTQMALSQRRVCEEPSPIVKFTDLTFTNAELRLEGDGQTLDLVASDSRVNALSAALGREENTLSGWVKLDGDLFQVPFDQAGLDPDYDAAQSQASWLCDENLADPIDFEHCSYAAPLGEMAARLLVQALAVATQVLDADTSCGFKANAVLTTASTSSANNTVTWSTLNSPCAIDFAEDSVVATDCTGTTTHVHGGLTAATEKTIHGELTGGPERVWPVTRDAEVFHHASLQLRDWSVFALGDGQNFPDAKITVNANLSASMRMLGGESRSHNTAGGAAIYDVNTPLFILDDFTMSSGSAHILVAGKQFDLNLTQVLLQAQKGRYLGQGNSLSGSLRVDGELIDLPAGLPVDPAFAQEDFNASYACTVDLVEAIPAN